MLLRLIPLHSGAPEWSVPIWDSKVQRNAKGALRSEVTFLSFPAIKLSLCSKCLQVGSVGQ
jgi:hypothetical protein